MPYQIKSPVSSYDVTIDNYKVVYTPLRVGSDLEMSKMDRREKFINKKLKVLQESAETKEDFDEVEKLIAEKDTLDAYGYKAIRSTFSAKDGDDTTTKWLDSLPFSMLITYISEINNSIELANKESQGGEKPASV